MFFAIVTICCGVYSLPQGWLGPGLGLGYLVFTVRLTHSPLLLWNYESESYATVWGSLSYATVWGSLTVIWYDVRLTQLCYGVRLTQLCYGGRLTHSYAMVWGSLVMLRCEAHSQLCYAVRLTHSYMLRCEAHSGMLRCEGHSQLCYSGRLTHTYATVGGSLRFMSVSHSHLSYHCEALVTLRGVGFTNIYKMYTLT